MIPVNRRSLMTRWFAVAAICSAFFTAQHSAWAQSSERAVALKSSDSKLEIDTEKAVQRISGKWFDSETGGYKPPTLQSPIDDSIRRTGWEGKPKPVKQPSRWGNWSLGNLGLNGEAFGWIVLGVLGTVLLFGLIMIAYYYLGDQVPALRKKSKAENGLKIDPTRVEDLPFEVSMANDDPLSHAEGLMNAGKYNEATIYLFGYMLLVLDQTRKIHLQKGKTNRMYLRELRNETQLQAIVSMTMLAFEDVFFGRYDIDRARFEMLWQRRDDFHRLVRPSEPVATSRQRKWPQYE